MPRPSQALAILALLLSACSDFPDLSAEGLEAAEQAPYPQLIPLVRALDAADTTPAFTAEDAAALQARAAGLGRGGASSDEVSADRVARLQARAAILRGPLQSEAQIEAMRRALAGL